MPRLVTAVRVQDGDGNHVVIGPGDAPQWVVPLVTNPAAWEDEPEGEGPVVAPEPKPGQGDGEPTTEPSPEPEAPTETWPAESDPGYESMTVTALRALATDRNAGRDPSERLPVTGSKADLVAALTVDDES